MAGVREKRAGARSIFLDTSVPVSMLVPTMTTTPRPSRPVRFLTSLIADLESRAQVEQDATQRARLVRAAEHYRNCPTMLRANRSAITSARISTSKRLATVELHACFTQATVSAAVNAIDRNTVSAKASRRRLVTKALRVSGAA